MIGTRVWCYDKDIFGFSGKIIQQCEDKFGEMKTGFLIARDYDGAVFYRTAGEFEVKAPSKVTDATDSQTLP